MTVWKIKALSAATGALLAVCGCLIFYMAIRLRPRTIASGVLTEEIQFEVREKWAPFEGYGVSFWVINKQTKSKTPLYVSHEGGSWANAVVVKRNDHREIRVIRNGLMTHTLRYADELVWIEHQAQLTNTVKFPR